MRRTFGSLIVQLVTLPSSKVEFGTIAATPSPLNGAAFYGMAANDDTIRLVKRDVPAEYPSHIPAGDETVTVFDPGFPLYWHVEDPA